MRFWFLGLMRPLRPPKTATSIQPLACGQVWGSYPLMPAGLGISGQTASGRAQAVRAIAPRTWHRYTRSSVATLLLGGALWLAQEGLGCPQAIAQTASPSPAPTTPTRSPSPSPGARPAMPAVPLQVVPPPAAAPTPRPSPTPQPPPRSTPAPTPTPTPAPTPTPTPAPTPTPRRTPAPLPPPRLPPPPTSRPIPPALGSDFDRYVLGAGDTVFVNVQRFNDLSFQGTIDVEGNLLVPLVGALRVQGLTLPQARQRIRIELNRFVVDPQVDITLVSQRPVRVTVLGDVFRPGYYGLEAPLLITALVASGGATQTADLRLVRIRRTLPNGTTAERRVDLYTPLIQGTALPNVRLVDGDAVVVSSLPAGAIAAYDRDRVARSTLAQPLINIRVLNYAGTRPTGGRQGITNLALPNGSTFLDALTAVSPNPDSADLSDIALIRYDLETGQAMKRDYNGRRALRGDLSQNPSLQHNDVIVIGRNFVSRVTYALSTFTQPFRDILGFLLFFDGLVESADNVFRPGRD